MQINELLRRIVGLLAPYWRSAILIFVGLLIEMSFHALVPFSFKFIVDDGLLGGDKQILIGIIAGLAAGAVLVSVTGLARDYLYARVASRILADLRQRIFSHMLHLSMEFFARFRAGDILSRFSGDLASIETALANAISWCVLPLLEVLTYTTLLFVLDWRLALLAMLVWPLSFLGMRIFAPRAVDASYLRKRDEGETIATIQENFAAQSVVKALNLQQISQRNFDDGNARLMTSVLRVSFFSAMVERSYIIGIMLLQVAVLGGGAWMAGEKLISVGTLTAFQALFMSLAYSLFYATQYIPTLIQAAGGMRRVEEIFLEVPRVSDAPRATRMAPLAREIALESVTFGYTSETTNLREVSLSIPMGTSVAFVGASGSGKSTILNLLMRLYDPSTGHVRFDGCDLRDATQESLRAQMSVVPQESVLFNTSIAENIRMGKLDASMKEIEQAAREAEIHDYILTLPQGYDTPVGERGGRLSGGQRQRVAIARAIVRDPRILLLDEATSSLDPGTETAVNDTLARVGKGRTQICVTHRLASAVGADRIYVFDRGRLVEHGSHQALLQKAGPYSHLWAKQNGFTVNAEGDHATVTAERLRALPVLDQLDAALLADVARLFVTEQHPRGRTVCHEGDPGDRFYIIARGSVEIQKAAAGAVGVLQDGDSFGEIALLRNVPRTASVHTLTPCTLLSLQREQFDSLLERVPQLRERLEKMSDDRSVVPPALIASGNR